MDLEKQDPRHRNATLDYSSVGSYMRDYAAALRTAIEGISSEAVEEVCSRVLKATASGKQIFVIGNGGSAAVAEHLCCDWTKGTNCAGYPVIVSRSLTSNVALYSAIANDYGFEHVFDTQLEFFAGAGDVLIAISSSGNSPNVLNAVRCAKELGMFVAGFSGFSGGKLAEAANASVYVGTNNYGIVEDAHQAVMHIIAQYIACRRDNGQGA
jgi:D-sedoheptulose 7-phosphate isomerase